MEAVVLALTPFVLNAVMAVAKWIGAQDTSTPFKRTLLALFAIIGVVAGNTLAGTPITPDSISNDAIVLVQSFVMFVAAHGTYNLFWAAKK